MYHRSYGSAYFWKYLGGIWLNQSFLETYTDRPGIIMMIILYEVLMMIFPLS